MKENFIRIGVMHVSHVALKVPINSNRNKFIWHKKYKYQWKKVK